MSARLQCALFIALGTGAASACVPSVPGGSPRKAYRGVPGWYTSGSSKLTLSSGKGRGSGKLGWKQLFDDPHLRVLITEALRRNQELNLRVQEQLMVKAEIVARRGAYLPRLDFRAGAGIEKVGKSTSQGASDEMANLPENLQDYSMGLYATWEVPIWGKLINLKQAAMKRYLASVEGRHFLATQIVAEVARSYVELMALDRKEEVLTSGIELLSQALEAVKVQQQAGAASAVAVARFEAELRGRRAELLRIQQKIVQTENGLNVLIGRTPRPVQRSSETFLERQPPVVSVGVPGQLLANRPDVRRAEYIMQAAALNVRAARKRFYPSLTIEGGVGYQAFNITKWFATPGSIFYSLFAGITAPLLNRAEITANFNISNAKQMSAVLNFERTVLTAFVDVVNGYNAVNRIGKAVEQMEKKTEILGEAVRMVGLLFKAAEADYLEVLTARRDWLQAQLDTIEAKRDLWTATVRLYRGLGGGWRASDDLTTGRGVDPAAR